VRIVGDQGTEDRVGRHGQGCVGAAFAAPAVRVVLHRWGIGEADLLDLYVRLGDAGATREERAAALASPHLLDRFGRALDAGHGRLDPRVVDAFARWARATPAATLAM
jgi:hypothetical protein